MRTGFKGFVGAFMRQAPRAACAAATATIAMSSSSTAAEGLRNLDDPIVYEATSDSPGLKFRSRYSIIAAPGMEEMAIKMVTAHPEKFQYFPTKWGKFPDGTDNIKVGGFEPSSDGHNHIAGRNVLFLANFDSNASTLSQYFACVMLCESFVRTMTVLLPFYPTATMERVTEEGTLATANCTAKLFSNLPNPGQPVRVMCYDLHTLQNRFFFGNNALATLHSSFPLMIQKIKSEGSIDAIAFPDDGAEKRYGFLFKKHLPDAQVIVCGKKRDPNDSMKRVIEIKDGDPRGRRVLIVDDLMQSGGTLAVCGCKLKDAGAIEVSGFCAHAVLPGDSAERFISGDRSHVFKKLYVTNTCPTTTDKLPEGGVFEVLDLTPQIMADL